MPPIKKETVDVKITRRFDHNGRLYGPGVWPVTPATAHSLIEAGRATRVGGAPVATKPPATGGNGKPSGTNPRIPPQEPELEPTETPLPEGFPCQGTLAVAGFTTVESLQVPDVKELLEKVEGLTPADVTKIGIAISKV